MSHYVIKIVLQKVSVFLHFLHFLKFLLLTPPLQLELWHLIFIVAFEISFIANISVRYLPQPNHMKQTPDLASFSFMRIDPGITVIL